MKFSGFFLALFCLHAPLSSWGQKNKRVDSLLNLISVQKDTALVSTYNELFMAQFVKTPDVAKPYLDTALIKAKRLNNKRIDAKLILSTAIYHDRVSDYSKAEELYKEAMDQFIELDDQKNLRVVHNYLGAVLLFSGQLEESLQYFLKSLKISEKLDLRDMQKLNSLGNIAAVYFKMENYESSLEYYHKTLNLGIENKLDIKVAQIRLYIGTIYSKRNEKAKALDYFLKSLEYFEKNKVYQFLPNAYNNLGNYYAKLDSFEKAENYFNKALAVAEESEQLNDLPFVLKSLGEIKLKRKNYNGALKNLLRSLSISESTGLTETFAKTYSLIAKTYAAKGDYRNAYKYDTLFFKQYDTILKAENIKKLNELMVQYQTEKKEQQIAQQETEISLLEEQEKVSNLQKIALGGGLGLSAVALGFGFYGFRQKLKRNQLEKEKVDAELQLKESELAFKKKELTSHALHLAKKNEVLENVKQKARELKSSENGGRGYQQLIQTINFDQQDDKNWENFTHYFEQVHKDFSKTVKVKYPEVTKNELRLMALLKMNLSSKEIATILNISSDGVKKARQRLRKKMELSPEESLESTVLSI